MFLADAPLNPYWGKTLTSFFALFVERMAALITGKLSFEHLASDEIQLFVLMLVAIASSLVGVFLVLKKMTMLANSLSHTILLGIVLAYLLLIPFTSGSEAGAHSLSLTVLLIAAMLTGVLTTLLTELMTRLMKLPEDASIGLVFTNLFALGIILVTLFTRNTHIGIEAVMGNADALHFDDLKLIASVCLLDLVVVLLFFKELHITSFDPGLASSLGIKPSFFNILLMILVAATAIASFRAVGVLLVLAFIVGPALIARLCTHRLKILLPLAAAIGAFCSLFGVALARHLLTVYHMPLSTGGLIVTLIAIAYLLALLLTPGQGIVSRALLRKKWKKIR